MYNTPSGRIIPLLATLAVLAIGGTDASAQNAQPLVSPAPGFPACPDSTQPPDVIVTPCLAIVDFDDSVASATRAGVIRGAGAVMRFGLGVMNAAAAMVPNEDAWWSLALDPSVTRLYPDLPVHAIAPPSCSPWPDCKNGGGTIEPPPAETLGEGLLRIGADMAWTTARGAGIGVAIIDTGLDSDHPDLAANIGDGVNCLAGCVLGGWEDDHGHGTHVGGIVAAVEGNGLDIAGVAPDARLHAVKVLDASGSGSLSGVIAGVEWAAARGPLSLNGDIHVANLSLGATGACADAPAMQAAIDAARAAGVTVVVAAGNNSNAEISNMIPAGCAGVVAVASTTAEDGKSKCRQIPTGIPADVASYFTTDGEGVTVSAPGEAREDNNCATIQSVGILSLAKGGGTVRMSGTSMAAPHVAGVVALMYGAKPDLSPATASDILGNTADLIGTAPLDNPYIGTFDGTREGVVDATAALAAASSLQ